MIQKFVPNMPPKLQSDSIDLSRLKRRRGQFRFLAVQAMEGLKARILEHEVVDSNTAESWMFTSLEEELRSLESRIVAYSDSHVEVQIHSESQVDGDNEDEDSDKICDMQMNLVAIERKVRTLKHQCNALSSQNQFPVGVDTPVTNLSRPYRINTSLKPTPLTSDINLADFIVWRQMFKDFYDSNQMEHFPLSKQRAQLRGCMDVGMIQTLSQYLDIEDDESVDGVLEKLQVHLAKSVNIARRRHDFNTLKQKEGESFCDLFVRLKLVGGLAELQNITYEELLASRLIVAISNQELQRELLFLDNPTLSEVKTKCESWEAGDRNQAALQIKSTVRVDKTSTYKTQKRGKAQDKSKSLIKNGPNLLTTCDKCGFDKHTGSGCPAKDQRCIGCGKHGHFRKVCLSEKYMDSKKGNDEVVAKCVCISSAQILRIKSDTSTPTALICIQPGSGSWFKAEVLPD